MPCGILILLNKIKILFTFDSFVDSVNIREVEMQNIVTRQIFGFVFLFSRVQDIQRRERKPIAFENKINFE